MKDRLFSLIETLHLTPTEFADIIGISRSAISSIKTGRTQPTLQLVEKIKQFYPDVDVQWLIFGGDDVNMFGNIPSQQPVMALEPQNQNTQQQIDFTDADHQPSPSLSHPSVAVAHTVTPQTAAANADFNAPERKVIRIITFYSDGSYQQFIPE